MGQSASQVLAPPSPAPLETAASGVSKTYLESIDKSEFINVPKTLASTIEYPPESRKQQALAALFLFANEEYKKNHEQPESCDDSSLYHCREICESIAAASYSIADSLKAFDEQEQALFVKMEEDAKLNPTNASGHTDTHLAPITYRALSAGAVVNGYSIPLRAIT